MRNYETELKNRTEFIKNIMKKSGAKGIVYGNSGGKDSALVGILCKKACDNTVGIIMPCCSKMNYGQDKDDAQKVAKQFNIETRIVDLTEVRNKEVSELEKITKPNNQALINIPPRLRMTTLYAIGAAENRLVAGTGNKSELYMGYFTKWGDGACDFNPIADLTAGEVFEFLKYLNAPVTIIDKAPSAGLYEGQTDEKDMGIKYSDIDNYLLNEICSAENKVILDKYHNSSEHKRNLPLFYPGN